MTYSVERTKLLQRAGRDLSQKLLPKPFSLWYSDHDTGCQMTIVAKVGTDWSPVWKGSIWHYSRYEFNDQGDIAGLQPDFEFARDSIETYFREIGAEVARLDAVCAERKEAAAIAAARAKSDDIDTIRRTLSSQSQQQRQP